MYSILLHSHNGLRLLILPVALITLGYLISGIIRKAPWAKTGKILTSIYTGLMDLQVLVGLLLYVGFSPITKAAFSDFGAAMKNSELRFYAVEHISLMLLAVVFAHIAGKMAKKGSSDKSKWMKTTLWVALSIVAVLVAIPWNRAWM